MVVDGFPKSNTDATWPDDQTVERVVRYLVRLEDKNDKSHRYSDSDMVKQIVKKIEGESGC